VGINWGIINWEGSSNCRAYELGASCCNRSSCSGVVSGMSMDSSAGGDPMGSGDPANSDGRAFDDKVSGGAGSGGAGFGGAVFGDAGSGGAVFGDKGLREKGFGDQSVDEMDTLGAIDAMADLDLDADRAGLGGAEASVAALFRAGLEPDAAQTRRVIAGLPAIQDRARRGQRRRQALAVSAAALAVAASAVLVSGLPGTPRASVVTPAGAPTGTSSSTSTSSTSATEPSPTTAVPSPFRVRSASLLTISSLTVFRAALGAGTGSDAGAGRMVEESAPEDIGGQPVITGVCVDSAVPGESPVRGWQASWRTAELPAKAIVPPGLIEKIWQWDNAQAGPALLDRLEKELVTCSAKRGLEGRGPTTKLATGKQFEKADRVLATAASDGQGNQAVQVVMLVKGVVVQLDAVIPDDVSLAKGTAKAINEKQSKFALWLLTPTLQVAIERVAAS
jgi:hypothetical protein